MTYDQGLSYLIDEVKAAWWAVVEIHMDPTHLNNESEKYKSCLQRFHEANMAVFRWKIAWYEIAGTRAKGEGTN